MAEDEKPRARMGRPPKAPEKGKRQNYTFRLGDVDRQRLVEATELSKRSISEEIEFRLGRSFDYQNIDEAVNEAFLRYMRTFFGGYNNPLAMAIMASHWQRAISTAERRIKSKKPWFEDATKQQHMIEELQRGARAAVMEAAHSERTRAEDSRIRRREYLYARKAMKNLHKSEGSEDTE